MRTVLIIDDNPAVAQALQVLFGLHDIATLSALTPEAGLALLAQQPVELVIADMNFSADTTSGDEGVALFKALRARRADLPVILLTAWTHLEAAVQLVKAGAADYLSKPWDNDKLLATVENLLELAEANRERERLRDEQRRRRERLSARYDLCGIVFASDAMERAVELACRVARADVPVLITGPNGAGKERIAQIVHANSAVGRGPFVAVNCGAIPGELIEAELFGAEAGAFTGAVRARVGRFELADGGTLFLDEIGNLPLAGQVKLLRVLETGQFELLGSSKTRSSRVRILSATNADLPTLIRAGTFREDLYYRLNVIEVALPPLAERRADILPLARHFLGKDLLLSEDAAAALLAHDWHGNVRELRNSIERAKLMARAGTVERRRFKSPRHATQRAAESDGGPRRLGRSRSPARRSRASLLRGGRQREPRGAESRAVAPGFVPSARTLQSAAARRHLTPMSWRLARVSFRIKLGSMLLGVAAGAAALGIWGSRWLGNGLWTWLAIVGLGTLPAFWLAGRLLRPIRQLLRALSGTVASYKEGNFSQSLVVDREDELGELMTAHNELGTALRLQRAHLVQRELLLDTVMQNSPVALVLVDSNERIAYANLAARQILSEGRSLSGLPFADILQRAPPALQAAAQQRSDSLFSTDVDGVEETFHLSQRAFVLQGRPYRLYLLKRLTRELSRQEVSTWKKLIRVLSHELNNSLGPLSSLAHSGAELARRGDLAALPAVFRAIAERAEHLHQFVGSYATFAKLPAPRPERIVWETFIADLARQAEFSIATLPSVPGWFDRGQLEQALINLVKNAHEAGGADDAVELVVICSRNEQRLEVRDRGSGMSPAVLAQALLPFYSTKRSGTGLGLALAREIAEAHGGRIHLANRDGGGLSVLLDLPIVT